MRVLSPGATLVDSGTIGEVPYTLGFPAPDISHAHGRTDAMETA